MGRIEEGGADGVKVQIDYHEHAMGRLDAGSESGMTGTGNRVTRRIGRIGLIGRIAEKRETPGWNLPGFSMLLISAMACISIIGCERKNDVGSKDFNVQNLEYFHRRFPKPMDQDIEQRIIKALAD